MCIGVEEGRFTLIIAASSYLRPKRAYIAAVCTHTTNQPSLNMASPLYLCNNLKFALEPCGWGILHFCANMDSLTYNSMVSLAKSFWHGRHGNSVDESTFDTGIPIELC